MTDTTSSAWIDAFLSAEPPRSKSLVMTVLGDAIAPHGGAVWLGSLIELVAPLTVTDRLARTSVFRLVQEGWIEATREGRRSRYALAADAGPRIARANARIYAPPAEDWDGQWTLLLSPNGSLDAPTRALLRRELGWEGFALLGAGLLAHPAPDHAGLADTLARLRVADRLFACRAAALPQVGARPLGELVGDGWQLDDVTARYAAFIDRFTPLLGALQAEGAPAPQAAWMIRTLLIHAYRRVQLHDPMLPLSLLPSPWPGSAAYALARALYRLTWESAEAHLLAMLRREDPAAPEADAAFYQRFGGLR